MTPATPDAGADGHASMFTERQLRDALGEFATGVAVICARRADGRHIGFTANSFNSVSLDPPLVVWSLDRRAENLSSFQSAARYAINVLAHDQAELAHRFSRPHADRFAGVPFRLGVAEAPLIEGCVAWFECRHHSQQRAGDHVLFIGHVETCARRKDAGLVFHQGRFSTTHAREHGEG